jgi:hypothetical protein
MKREFGINLDELPSIDGQTSQDVVRHHFDAIGAFVVRGLFTPEQIGEVREVVLSRLQEAEWIADVVDGVPQANSDMHLELRDRAYLRTYRRVAAAPNLHALPRSDSVRALASTLGINDFFSLPRVVLRMVFPGATPTHAHQDWSTVQGTPETVTLWVPLVRCDPDIGPIATISGSHLRGEWPRDSSPGADVDEIDVPDSERWSSARLAPGDAVVFRSLTVHRGLPNNSEFIRLSVDFRIQDMTQPLHPGSLLPPEGFRSWDDVYASWEEERHVRNAYFWRVRHPPIQPSASELRAALENANGMGRRHLERLLRNLMEQDNVC